MQIDFRQFSWAERCMRAGQRLRRRGWEPGVWMAIDGDVFVRIEGGEVVGNVTPTEEDRAAKDWERSRPIADASGLDVG